MQISTLLATGKPSNPEYLHLQDQLLQKPQLLKEVVVAFLGGPATITQRAAGLLLDCVRKNPCSLSPFLEEMLVTINAEDASDAIKRNTIRLLQFISIPEELEGEVMDVCFSFLSRNKEAVAIKAFSMTVLCQLAQKYPEIINELKVLIIDRLPFEKPAFTSRAGKVLQVLAKKSKTRASDF